MPILESNPHYIIYFDNIRVDEFVKDWNVQLSCGGAQASATINFIYLPELANKARENKDMATSDSIKNMLGAIDNMTNVKIFAKNVFSNKYQLVFDGSIKGKSSSRAATGSSLTFRAVDYTAWLQRTTAPLVISYNEATHPSEKFVYEAQGIDVSKVTQVYQRAITKFKGKRLEEIINIVTTQALAANKLYSDKRGVGFWDGVWDRMDLMADIDKDVLEKSVLDYVISPNMSSSQPMYTLMNDIFAKTMFEFYQDRDGVIRIKPPFWSQPVLKSHIIDPVLITNQGETSDYDGYITRVIVTGGLDEVYQTANKAAQDMWTPMGCYMSDGTWNNVHKVDGYKRDGAYIEGQGRQVIILPGGGTGLAAEGGGSSGSVAGVKNSDGGPRVGYGDPSRYAGLVGNGEWYPTLRTGIRAHVQLLRLYFKGSVTGKNPQVSPPTPMANKARTVADLSRTWASNANYGAELLGQANRFYGTRFSVRSLGADSVAQWEQDNNKERLDKLVAYWVKHFDGKQFGRDYFITENVTMEAFARAYIEEAKMELMSPDILMSQVAFETRWLEWKGNHNVYQQNNFAGIKVNSAGAGSKASDYYWTEGSKPNTTTSGGSSRVGNYDISGPDGGSGGSVGRTVHNTVHGVVDSVIQASHRNAGTAAPKAVIIDAGHGGWEYGIDLGTGDNRCIEKTWTFEIQNAVVNMLNKNGIFALRSRDTPDEYLGNEEARLKYLQDKLRKFGQDPAECCMVTIHMGYGDHTDRGYRFFVSTETGQAASKSYSLAQNINANVSTQGAKSCWDIDGYKQNPDLGIKTTGACPNLLSPSNWPLGAVMAECAFLTNYDDRRMVRQNKHDLLSTMAFGIARGVGDFMGNDAFSYIPEFANWERMSKPTGLPGGVNPGQYNNPSFAGGESHVTPDGDENQYAEPFSYQGSKFKEGYDFSSVDVSNLLKPTDEELMYGGTVEMISQPLIKFSNSDAFDMDSDANATARDVLKAYAKFYMNMKNSMVHTSVLNMTGAPWLRPGFNVWVDPIFVDKIYYISAITHSGSPGGGMNTTLQLVHGRTREEFLATGDKRRFGSLGDDDDNIFTKNQYFKSAKDFGPVLSKSDDYSREVEAMKKIADTLNLQGIVRADRSPYAAYYASDSSGSALKTPTIQKYDATGKEVFSDEEWKEITGRSDIPKKPETPTIVSQGGTKADASSRRNITTPFAPAVIFLEAGRTVLRRGMTGESVGDLQWWLNALNNAGLAIDRSFGPLTEAALKAYQANRGLVQNGIYDERTHQQIWDDAQALSRGGGNSRRFVNTDVLQSGKRGAIINQLQELMNEFMDRGIFRGSRQIPVTGLYHDITTQIIKEYQTAKKIRVTGNVGPITTASINKDLIAIDSGLYGGNPGSQGMYHNEAPVDGTALPPQRGDNRLTNTILDDKNPDSINQDKDKAKGRLSQLIMSGQYTENEIDAALNRIYKQAPSAVRRRAYVINQGIVSARKTAEKYYINNNFNKNSR